MLGKALVAVRAHVRKFACAGGHMYARSVRYKNAVHPRESLSYIPQVQNTSSWYLEDFEPKYLGYPGVLLFCDESMTAHMLPVYFMFQVYSYREYFELRVLRVLQY